MGESEIATQGVDCEDSDKVSARKLLKNLIFAVEEQESSELSRKGTTEDQDGAMFTTMGTCTMSSRPTTPMDCLIMRPAMPITSKKPSWVQLESMTELLAYL